MTQTAVEWLEKEIYARGHIGEDTPIWLKELYKQAKEMENEQKNNLPIHIHEGIENTWVYIEDGIVHVKPNPKANEQQ